MHNEKENEWIWMWKKKETEKNVQQSYETHSWRFFGLKYMRQRIEQQPDKKQQQQKLCKRKCIKPNNKKSRSGV